MEKIKIRREFGKLYKYSKQQDAYLYDVSLREIGANTTMSDKKIEELYLKYVEKRARLADQERFSRA